MNARLPKRTVLVVCTRPPLSGVLAREALDAIMAMAVFDIAVTVLFCGDGVWQLLGDPMHSPHTGKSPARQLAALPMYDVERLLADRHSLEERGIDDDRLADEVDVIDAGDIAALLAQHDLVLSL